jgi:zinc protease
MAVVGRNWFFRCYRGLTLLAAAVVLSGLLPATAARAGVFNPQTFTLKNGMQVVVVSNHRAPVVSQMVWYKVGSADEVDGKSGIAHFFEHLMFKGTPRFPDGEFSALVARNGGRENAFTSADYTGYYQTVAKDRLELVMELEADRMTNLVLLPEQIEAERLVVLEERRMRLDRRPGARLGEYIDNMLYLNHPYRRPIIGWEQEIKDLTLADLRAFYKKWYAPDNAILVVSGDITVAELKPLAEKYYGVIPPANVPKRVRAQEPRQEAARSVTLKDQRVRQPSWSRTFLAPSYTAGESQHAYALEVLSQIIAGGATSRLHKSLVVDQKLALGAYAGYDADARGPSSFVFGGSPAPGVSMEKLVAGIETEIATLIADGVTPEELAHAKVQMEASAIFARDSSRRGARVIGAALASGRTIEDVESWPERIAAVTVEQISAAARFVLREERSVSAYLLRKGAATAARGRSSKKRAKASANKE